MSSGIPKSRTMCWRTTLLFPWLWGDLSMKPDSRLLKICLQLLECRCYHLMLVHWWLSPLLGVTKDGREWVEEGIFRWVDDEAFWPVAHSCHPLTYLLMSSAIPGHQKQPFSSNRGWLAPGCRGLHRAKNLYPNLERPAIVLHRTDPNQSNILKVEPEPIKTREMPLKVQNRIYSGH